MRSTDSMNAEDVARYLNLGKNTVYQLAKTGQLASYKVGRKLRFSLDDVEAYLASTHQSPGGALGNAAVAANDHQSDPAGLSEAASFGIDGAAPLIIAGEDVVADVLASWLNASGMPTVHRARGSYTALVNLYAGDADMAVVSLYDQKTNSYNIPSVRSLAPGASVAVFRLYAHRVGFAVAKGNPKRLTTWGSLLRDGVRLSNRVKGSSARVLLDEKLRALEARSESIEGYESHAAVASSAIKRVSAGAADVAVGAYRDVAKFQTLDFVPLQDEWVDLVVAKNAQTRKLVRTLKDIFADGKFAGELEALDLGDCSRLGSITYEN